LDQFAHPIAVFGDNIATMPQIALNNQGKSLHCYCFAVFSFFSHKIRLIYAEKISLSYQQPKPECPEMSMDTFASVG
jgi:hypothetical protein